MKRFFTLLMISGFLLMTCDTTASAQDGKQLKKANELFEEYNYPKAAELYKKILSDADNVEAKRKLADCYRLMSQPIEAEFWYEQIAELDESTESDLLHYGMMLKMNGKCDLARDVFLQYAQKVPADTRGLRLVESCDKEEYFLQDPGVYQLDFLKINSVESDFGPAFFEEGIVFASARGGKYQDRTYSWTDSPYLDLFYSEGEAGSEKPVLKNAKLFKGKPNTWLHEGTVTFSRDQNTMYFTRNNFMNGKKGMDSNKTIRLKVYSSEREGETWGEIKELPFNSDNYSVGHPTLTADGSELYFVSDMPGGYGEEDIYVVYKEGDSWGSPVNLGPEINTEGREMFPFITDEGTLYFASDALPGLGGLDIYKSKDSYGAWSDPINLGFPINTVDDDFGFIINSEQTHGYFSSNRKGKGGDDIYTFTKLSVTVEINVFDEETKMPIEAADVFTPCSEVQNFLTNQDGKVIMELPLNQACDFAAEKLGYQPNSVRLSSKNEPPGKTLYVQIPLKLECIFSVSGSIVDGLTNEPVDSALVRMRSFCGGEEDELSMYTDAEGKYLFRDVREDCDIRVTVEKPGFTKGSVTFKTGTECGESAVANGEIDTNGTIVQSIPLYCYGPNCDNDTLTSDPTAVVDSIMNPDGSITVVYADGFEKTIKPDGTEVIIDDKGNETVIPKPGDLDIVNIYYDFDDARIRADAKAGLNDLVTLLNAYPEMKIKLTSHTDARGKRGYNKRLSKRRAESAIRYLMDKGIPKNRLQAKGMGEEVMINECYDGVECNEELHQENRRTEFIIIEYVPQGYDAKSRRPKDIKTNPCTNCPGASEVEGEIESIESSIGDY